MRRRRAFRAPLRRLLPPARLALGAGLVLALGACSRATYEGPYKHVLLISLDTTRADQLGCYGGTRARTPRLDALAAEGALFEDCSAAATTTLASHTSIFTGLYPRRHGVPRNGFMVPEEDELAAELLGRAGFRTAGFVASFALDQMFDVDQGFAHWDQDFDIEVEASYADQDQRRAERVTDAVLDYVDRVGTDERLFLFAHFFDAHAPYDPPEPFAAEYAGPGKPRRVTQLDINVQAIRHQQAAGSPPRDLFNEGVSDVLLDGSDGQPFEPDETFAQLYAGELAYLDRHVGRLLDGLAARGVLDDCVVVVVGDHGETFWEHADHWHHGAWVYQTNVHVPLIVRLPDGRGAGRRIAGLSSGVDVLPTLADLLGLTLPAPVDGVSLVPALDGAPLPDRAVFCEATQPVVGLEQASPWAGQRKPRALRRGRWKLIEAPYLGRFQLFDLEEDPGETRDLFLAPTPRAQAELPRLQRDLAVWSSAQDPPLSRFNATQTEEVLRRLRALGYAGEQKPGESSAGRDE
ncbi:MAG: sulfatase-like hydrolase/transferase [Planctomycetes bacterium]|nr:sulfatase-like hydrolase/transferase [Planctomycetota bacterium]